MGSGSFAAYLAGLTEPALRAVLTVRADARLPPAPRGFGELAQRLYGRESLAAALYRLDRDVMIVGRAVAALGDGATVPAVAGLLGVPHETVAACVLDLAARALVWPDGDVLRLPELLAAHFVDEIGGGRPLARLAPAALADDLRAATAAWVPVAGLTKPQLTAALTTALADIPAVSARIDGLPAPARRRLEELRTGYDYYAAYGGSGRRGVDDELIRAGLLIPVHRRPELPREVAVAVALGGAGGLTGPPPVPPAGVDPAAAGSAATAAALEAVRVLTVLLDHAGATPIVMLKKGGVGTRERSRLAAALSIPAADLGLWIDLAYAAGLLGPAMDGYAPTEAYAGWREAGPGARWAALAYTWYALEHAPTRRGTDLDGKELPPPFAEPGGAGPVRRSLLVAAHGGRSVRRAGAGIDWFCPLHGYDTDALAAVVDATVREGELLGVIALDAVSELGSHLLDLEAFTPDPVGALAGRCDPLLPEPPCRIVLQSDLTAIVAGSPSVPATRVLTAAAVAEARGTAAVWRFTPVSVRQAFDAGWDEERLRAELAALSDGPLPQALDYLVSDVARRHGQVRIRSARSCIVSDPATIAELLHTRSLARLALHQLAPTVLAGPGEPAAVLTALRAAGFSPMAEDSNGTMTVEARGEHRAVVTHRIGLPTRAPMAAADLATALRGDPTGQAGAVDPDPSGPRTETYRQLVGLATRLDHAAAALLADAIDHGTDVVIRYQDKSGRVTDRAIQPREIHGRWLDSWCYLRDAERDFALQNIRSVFPAP